MNNINYRIIVVEGMLPQKMLLIKKMLDVKHTLKFENKSVFPNLYESSRFIEGKAELLLKEESVVNEIVDLVGIKNIHIIGTENGKTVKDIFRGSAISFEYRYEENEHRNVSQENMEKAMKWRDELPELERFYFDILQPQPATASCPTAIA